MSPGRAAAPVRRSWRPDHWGLASRIVALSLLLLLLIQAAVFSVVRISIEQSARRQLGNELQVGERVWRRLLDQNAEQLRQGAGLLASDFGFRAAVNSGDMPTIQSALENQGARIGATITALMDTQMGLRAVGDASGAGLATTLRAVMQGLAQDSKGSQVALVGPVPHQFVMVPMKAPQLVGYVLMGFPIDQKLVDGMRAISDMHIAVLSDSGGEVGRVVVSTLSHEALEQLKARRGDVAELQDGGERLVVRGIRLDGGSGGSVRTLLMRSLDEVVAPFRQAQVALGWITALGVVLFGIGSVVAARRVTTPLRALLDATQRLGQGRYDVPMEHTERQNEIGELARAFDRMRVSIGAQQAEIRKLAYWDRLTGLPNRARFREALAQEIERRAAAAEDGPGNIAVIMLDIDRFKHVNDVLGYSFGDGLLLAVARRLGGHELRSADMVARLGGDEFAVLLGDGTQEQALAVAQRIARSFEVPVAIDEQTIDLSAGIGVAVWPTHGADADTLLSRAEVAMYAAKARTTGIQVYDPVLDSRSTQTLSLLTQLRQAIERDELRLYLQPKIRVGDAEVVAAEALVRWQHPQRGLVPPLEFIPFAEQTGFVRQLTLWMFARAAALSRALQAEGLALRMSVNLSTRDMLDLGLPGRLEQILQQQGVAAERFCLEITESAIMDDPERALGILERLAGLGFTLSIDDFGTGYSSLAYLKRLPVHELKIDKSFVMHMQDDADDAMIVRSTVDLAHNLGLTVVAEGVESAAILEQLRALACDEAQGYHIARPMPADQLAAWCRAHRPAAA